MAPQPQKDTAAVRKWKREIQAAGKREKEWRDKGEKIVDRYRGYDRKKSRFNVLWSNTEILRPAIFNSLPIPDVRRRFRDADPVGKAVSEIGERSLVLAIDDSDFEASIKNDILDALLPGRGLTRVRYVPSIQAVGGPDAEKEIAEDRREEADGTSPPLEGDTGYPDTKATGEELVNERVEFEHVDWRDYREGYGRTWAEVPWVAYRCQLDEPEACGKFGKEAVAGIKFAPPENKDKHKGHDEQTTTENVADFWEVWDKRGKRVFFLNDDCPDLLYPVDNPEGEPPLDLVGFFPTPDPLSLIENTGSRTPIPPFTLYQEQADALDNLSLRIQKIVDSCKLRGVYDAKLTELADLMTNDDNELTPVQQAQAWEGGLDKAISWFPLEPAAKTLSVLYEARANAKQIIDEVTGIADIIRGSTSAQETATAQQLKANYASVRLQRMQREVQRYIRDLLRLAFEVMANKFGQDTFAAMSQLKFPTEADKQRAVQQAQLAAQRAQLLAAQTGQPAPPPPGPDPTLMALPTWEDIMQVMRNDAVRHFRVDVETDSTVAGSLEGDMQGLSQLTTAVSRVLTELAPLVMQGALPPDAAKQLVMAMIRRAKLGMVVEDAFDKLQAPTPPQEPQDSAPQVAMIKAQSAQAVAAAKQQSQQQIAAAKLQQEAQIEALRHQMDAQAEAARQQAQAQIQALKEHMATERTALMEQFKNDRIAAQNKLDAAVKIMQALIAAKASVDVAGVAAEASQEVEKDLA